MNEETDVQLRPLDYDDLPRLADWLNTAHVACWWGGQIDLDTVKAKYGPRLSPGSPTSTYIIEVDQRPVGLIQCYRHADYPDWENDVGISAAAGIDYLIGEQEMTGKGIGARAIRLIASLAFALYPEVLVVASVPQKDNVPSWLALEKAGFERIDERKLDSDCPSDAGISYVYTLKRAQSVDK